MLDFLPFVIPVLFSLCYSHQTLYHELKRPNANIALIWPGRRAGHLQMHARGHFVMCCCSFCFFRLAACLHQRNSALKVLPSHWSWQAFPGLLLLLGGDPNTLSFHQWELRAHAKDMPGGHPWQFGPVDCIGISWKVWKRWTMEKLENISI